MNRGRGGFKPRGGPSSQKVRVLGEEMTPIRWEAPPKSGGYHHRGSSKKMTPSSSTSSIHPLTKTFQEEGISFPYKRLYTSPEKISSSFQSLISLNRSFDIRTNVSKGIREKGMDVLTFFDFEDFSSDRREYESSFVSYIRNEDDYLKYDWIVDYFIEDARIKAYRSERGKKVSPYEEWYRYGEYTSNGIVYAEENLPRSLSILENVKKYDSRTLFLLREGLYNQKDVEECANESPAFLKTLYQYLGCGNGRGKIFDATAGWGDRLAAAIALGVEKYLGVDPNTNSTTGFYEMVEVLGSMKFPGVSSEELHKRYAILPVPMPNCKLPDEDELFDIGFISPPSYNSEIYSQDSGQSTNLFENKGIWLSKFLQPTLKRLISKIKPGGYLIVQSILIEEFSSYITSYVGEPLVFLGPISVGTRPSPGKPYPRFKPMWIWRKVPMEMYVPIIDNTYISDGIGTSLLSYTSRVGNRSGRLQHLLNNYEDLRNDLLPEGDRLRGEWLNDIHFQEMFFHFGRMFERYGATIHIIPGAYSTENGMFNDIAPLRSLVWSPHTQYRYDARLSLQQTIKDWTDENDYESLHLFIENSDGVIASTRIKFYSNLLSNRTVKWLAKNWNDIEKMNGVMMTIEKLVVFPAYQRRVEDDILYTGNVGKVLDLLAISIAKIVDVRYVFCDVPTYRVRSLESMGFSSYLFHTKRSSESKMPSVEWTGMLLDLHPSERRSQKFFDNFFNKYSGYSVCIPSPLSDTEGIKTYFISGDSGLSKGALRYVLEYVSPFPFKELLRPKGRIDFVSQEWVRGTSKIIAEHSQIECTMKNILSDSKSIITNKWELWRAVSRQSTSSKSRENVVKYMMKSRLLSKVKKVKDGETLIVRPVGKMACSGNDVYVVNDNRGLENARRATSKYENAMVSEYILHPMLFQGLKFHLRMYYAVVCIGGKVTSYLFGIGKILTANDLYRPEDFSNKRIHDTHAETTKMNMWFPYDMNQGRDNISTIDVEEMYSKMRDVAKVLGKIVSKKVTPFPESKNAYEVFGCDFMFTEEGYVKLLEVNDKVGFTTILEPSEHHSSLGREPIPDVHPLASMNDDIYRRGYVEVNSGDVIPITSPMEDHRPLTFGYFSELFYRWIHDIAIYPGMV